MSIKKEVRKLVGEGRLDKALDLLSNELEGKDSSLSNDLIMLQARWNQNQRNDRLGIQSFQDSSRVKNQVTYALLSMLDDLEDEAAAPAPSPEAEPEEASASGRIKVFTSYAREDREWVEKLNKHLAPLKRQQVDNWTDSEILPGTQWNQSIEKALMEADIILLMISPDFLASEFINEYELPRALDRSQKGEAIVVPVILRPSTWDMSSFANLQALPRNADPIVKWENEDEAFVEVVKGLRALIEQIRRKKGI